MNNKTLGALALLGAPCMYLGIWAEEAYPSLHETWWTGFWGILYTTGRMAGTVGLQRIDGTGTRFGRIMEQVMLVTLLLANVSNVWLLVTSEYRPGLYWALDTCWPLSHILLIPYGIAVLRANRLTGWQRFAPLLGGLWLPLAMLSKLLPAMSAAYHPASVLNAAFFVLLALVVFLNTGRKPASVDAVFV